MDMTRKILALIAAACLALSLAACGNTAQTAQAQPEQSAPAPAEQTQPAEPAAPAGPDAPEETEAEPEWPPFEFTEVEGVGLRKFGHIESVDKYGDDTYEHSEDEEMGFATDEVTLNPLYYRSVADNGFANENLFTYDENGNMLTWTCSDSQDGLYSTSVYEYDAAGNRVRAVETSETYGGSVTEYEYDAAGNCVRETRTNDDGTTSAAVYEYNMYGDQVYSKNVDGDRIYELISEYSYQNGHPAKLIFTAMYDGEVSDVTTYTYEYGPDGTMTKMTQTDDYGTVEEEYDGNGNCAHRVYTSPGSEEDGYEEFSEYKENGDLIRSLRTFGNGSTDEELREYDDQGRVIREESVSTSPDSMLRRVVTYRYE